MFGCFRKGDANDPEIYVASITAMLSKYPEEIIIAVTHPATGMPIKTNFLPSVKEIYDACEEIMVPIRAAKIMDARRKKQLAERDEWERATGRAELSENLKRGTFP